MPRPTQPRWAKSKEPPADLNVLASGKRLSVLPPEYLPPYGGEDRRWRTQELRTEVKRTTAN